MNDDQLVYTLPYTSKSEAPKLHPDPDCWALREADAEPIEKPAHEFPDWREVCGRPRCASHDVEVAKRRPHPRSTEARLENRQAVYEALAAAGEPLTRREVQLEAHLSKKAALKTLSDLADLGQVERAEGVGDGRVPHYRLASMCPETPQRQRAQAHPAAIWVLGVVTSLLLMAAYAIATGVIVG